MITGYNFHLQGKRHKKKDVVCQDHSTIYDLFGPWKICAVADGVSSAAHSEIASKLACETACEFIKNAFPFDNYTASFLEDDIKAVIKSAMHAAANAVEAYADSQDEEYNLYDTTLVLALYNGTTAYMGMIGDSGIVVLKDDGELLLSTPMNDEEGHVFPLRFRTKYKVTTIEDVAAVYCTTDGLFSDFFLQFGEFDKSRADALIPYGLFSNGDVDAEEYLSAFKKKIVEFCISNESLTDDISVAFLMNTDKSVTKTKKAAIDIISSLKKMVTIYDEKFQKATFALYLKERYPVFTDDEVDALFDGTADLETVLESHKAEQPVVNEAESGAEETENAEVVEPVEETTEDTKAEGEITEDVTRSDDSEVSEESDATELTDELSEEPSSEENSDASTACDVQTKQSESDTTAPDEEGNTCDTEKKREKKGMNILGFLGRKDND